MVVLVQTQYFGNGFWSAISAKLKPHILKPKTAVQRLVEFKKNQGILVKSCPISRIADVFLWVLEVFGIGFLWLIWLLAWSVFPVDLPVIQFQYLGLELRVNLGCFSSVALLLIMSKQFLMTKFEKENF